MVDGGLEDKFLFDGETNKLLLSQPNGRMVDASWRINPNPLGFYHNGAVADVDGDGHLDVMITDLGIGSSRNTNGVFFLMGDGRGNFTGRRVVFPRRSASRRLRNFLTFRDPQNVSGAAFADFDGDGRVNIVSTTGFPDFRTGKITVRFHRQMPDGTFVEAKPQEIPSAIVQPFGRRASWDRRHQRRRPADLAIHCSFGSSQLYSTPSQRRELSIHRYHNSGPWQLPAPGRRLFWKQELDRRS